MPKHDIADLAINAIRTLSMDAVEAAKSGHPGTPMALAPVAYSLWNHVLRYDPADPLWPARDRFVLSCGHASMLLYSVLHLAGVRQTKEGKVGQELAVPMEHLQKFRQLHSRCPGHPELHETSGVETTTGPLGQGAANSVGMAIAQRRLAARFHRPGYELFDYRVYALCGDGDLMEGVSSEAASLAGHLRLANLCWIYDDNRITIEGETSLAFSEDVEGRFASLGWHVIRIEDVNRVDALLAAWHDFEQTTDRPTLIIVRSHIGWGSPNKQDSHDAHGAPLGADEVRLTKGAYGWPVDEKFLVPPEVRRHFAEGIGARGAELSGEWRRLFAEYAQKHAELAEEWRRMERGELPPGWDKDLVPFPADAKGMASRISSGKALNAVARHVPWLVGGSADLAPSTMTLLTFDDAGHFEAENYAGRNFHFGIREHAMASIMNGMALSKLRPYGATFFVFSDYLRPAMRLSALMRLPTIYIFTHDSIGVGEDGPTHQPVEHLAAARAIPNLIVLRPADANEVVEAWRTIVRITDRPVALVLTRQNLPTLDRNRYAPASGLARGGYVLADADPTGVDLILIGTGSEVSLCVEAMERLKEEGLRARVVSMPSWELFEAQDAVYRQSVLPAETTARVGVEAGVRLGWDRYLGPQGRFVGMSSFGASAPGGVLAKHFGLTTENVVAQAKEAAGR